MTVAISAPAIAATGSSSNGTMVLLAAQHAVADHDRERGGEARARRDAGERRIGERIAEQPLHHGAAGREQRADHDGERDARQADRPQHQLVARDVAASPCASPSAAGRRLSGMPAAPTLAAAAAVISSTASKHAEHERGRAQRAPAEQAAHRPRPVVISSSRTACVRTAAPRAPAPDRARRRDRAPPSRCAGRSRADKVRPSPRRIGCAAAGVIAKAACANSVLASSGSCWRCITSTASGPAAITASSAICL